MKSKPESPPLRILILEDNPADAELIERQLRRAGIAFSFHLVESKRGFEKALQEFKPEVILSDYKLPKFDGLAALEAARAQAPGVPFIFVSGSIGEEKAIETLALGASDYIFKDNMARLGPAVKRVVEASRLKREKGEIDEELQHRVEELHILAKAADRFVHLNDLDRLYDYLAQVICEISGADYLLLSLYDETLQAVRPKVLTGFEPYAVAIRRRLGIDPAGMVIFLKEMRADDFADFVSQRLRPVRDGLYGLANRKVPRAACRLIERMMGITDMHTMGFSWENQLFGGVTVFFKRRNDLKNAAQIEALVNLAAVAIKRLLAEKSLRASEERFRHISATTSDISYSCHADEAGAFSLSWISGATERITGYKVDEIMPLGCWGKLVVPEDLPNFNKHVTGLTPGNSGICELRLLRKDGGLVWVQSFAQAMEDAEGTGRTVLYGGLMDISDKKRIYEQLRLSEEYYRTLVETSPDAITIIDAGGRVSFASQKTYALFGIPAQTALEGISLLEFVEPGEAVRVQARLAELLSGRALPEVREYRLQRLDRQPFWGEISSAPLRDSRDRIIGLLLVCRDISERMRNEHMIRSSLREKEVLLQEIHHRVKNNLQIVSGLLTMQADASSGRSFDEIIRSSQERIRSIALVHEKLYRSHNLAEIAFDEYLRALVDSLLISHLVDPARVSVSYDLERILFTIETAIPLGLIVNELVTNALKHAFPDGRQGEIRVTLQECRGVKFYAPTEDTGTTPMRGQARRAPACELIIEDDGVGLPPGFDLAEQKSLGMNLIGMLSTQLQAELQVTSRPGTRFRLQLSGLPPERNARREKK